MSATGTEAVTLKRVADSIGHAPPIEVLPDGMQRLEYISGQYNPYINTGFKPTGTSRVEIDFRFIQMPSSVGGWESPMGARGTPAENYANAFCLFADVSNGKVRTDYGTVSDYFMTTDTERHTIVKDGGKTYVDGVLKKEFEAQTFTSSYDMYIFANSSGNMAELQTQMELYGFRAYDGGVQVRNMVPAKLSGSGEVGLYDVVGNKFYASVGINKNFTAGPSLDPVPDVGDCVITVSQLKDLSDYLDSK